MRILLTNDDGIDAPGFAVLEAIAATLSDDVWVVAPDEERSGAGHSLTITAPIRIRKIHERRFAVAGTPTDCVMMALGKLMSHARPDLILSGVNRGANMAEDVTYSGTVSAAMEGTLAEVPSIALSQACVWEGPPTDDMFASSRAHAPAILQQCLATPMERGVLYNVNFPAGPADFVKGVRITEQGFRDVGDMYVEERTDLRGLTYYWFGLAREVEEPGHDTDLKAIREGYISITPLHLDLTHRPAMTTLKARFT